MYCCSILQNKISRQLFGTCTNHIFTTCTRIQKSQFLCQQDKDGFKIENFRPTFFIWVVEPFKFPFKFLSLPKSWTRSLAFSIESPHFIARIVAWVMFNWNWSTNRSAQQPSLLRVGFESSFTRQLSATNRASVIRSILADYFYIEWAHIIIYIIVRTWIQGNHRPKAEVQLEKSVRT